VNTLAAFIRLQYQLNARAKKTSKSVISMNPMMMNTAPFHTRTKYLLSLMLLLTILAGCGGGAGVDPVVEAFGIAYVKRPLGDSTTSDVRTGLDFQAGGDLYFRNLASVSAPERDITSQQTGGQGDVRDVAVSFDGSKLLFALHAPEIKGADPADQPTWNIWEYDITANRLRRVIGSDITAEAGQDIAPYYLPDGRIVFSSTRQRQSKAILLDEGKAQFSAVEERRQEPALVLHVMNADGSDIHQISFNQSHDLDPIVLQNGRILFSRWDNMGSRSQISLYSIRPDGAELQLVYGAHSHATGTNGTQVQFLRPQEMPNGMIMSLLRPFSSAAPGGNLVLIDTADYIDNDQPTRVNRGILNGPGQTPATINAVRTDAQPSPGGRFSAGYPLWDGTRRALVSWSPCRLLENSRIVPCTTGRLSQTNAVEAPPLYGIYMYNMVDNTQLPLVLPQEGWFYTDIVAALPRQLPAILPDRTSGVELQPEYVDAGVGILDILSIYDFDGSFNPLGTTASTLTALADPAQFTADQRPARFLRIVKAVGIPDRDTLRLRGTAFGRSSQQLMREIIGYAPIEPDGSVKIKVPANVPLAISVVDKDGRRIGPRHQNWLQLRPGEELRCNGCHDHNSGLPHGHPQAAAALNTGAPTTGLPFPNTDPALFANMGETMAETRTRLDPAALETSVDLIYDDVWTDPVAAGRSKDTSFSARYSDLSTAAPTTTACETAWQAGCRTVINYEQYIHPLWAKDRGVNTCTSCHGTTDAMNNLQLPAAQLDLGDGPSSDQADHFKSYRELLFNDNEQEINMGALQDRLVQATDANGNLLFEVDGDGNLILDANGNPIPVMVSITVRPSMSTAGAANSSFFDRFATGGTHAGRLDPAELKLIAEWLDIGAQYYNNPFDAPPP